MAKGPKATSGRRTREIKCGKVLLPHHILEFLLIGATFALLRRNLPYKVGFLQFWVGWTYTYEAFCSISSDAAGEISSQSANGFRSTVARFVPVVTSWECIISSSQSRVPKDQLYTLRPYPVIYSAGSTLGKRLEVRVLRITINRDSEYSYCLRLSALLQPPESQTWFRRRFRYPQCRR